MSAAGQLRIPVLMYHEIADATRTASHLAVAPAVFDAQLAYLRDAGYTTVTAGEVAAVLAGHPARLPERPVVLTFDDGYEDFHSQAMPLLARYGCTATLFMTSGFVQVGAQSPDGMPMMLNWRQLGEAASSGVEIAAHSKRHPQLDQLSDSVLHEELYASKSALEDGLGMAVPGLAYPFGYSDATVRRVAREAGYAYGYSVDNAITTSGTDLFTLPRLTVQRATTLDSFGKMVSGQDTLQLRKDRVLTRGYSVVRRARKTLRSVRTA